VAAISYSFFDFILSYPALFHLVIYYFVCRGVLLKLAPQVTINPSAYGVVSAVAGAAAVLALMREVNYLKAETALERGDIRKALSVERLAQGMISEEARFIILGNAYLEKAKRTNRKADWDKSMYYLNSGLKLNDKRLQLYPALLYANLQTGKHEESVDVAYRLKRQNLPLRSTMRITHWLCMQRGGTRKRCRFQSGCPHTSKRY